MIFTPKSIRRSIVASPGRPNNATGTMVGHIGIACRDWMCKDVPIALSRKRQTIPIMELSIIVKSHLNPTFASLKKSTIPITRTNMNTREVQISAISNSIIPPRSYLRGGLKV
jgi:hypothetical protein